MLKICHININSIHNPNNKADLMSFIEQEKIDIICLAETWSKARRRCKISGFNCAEDPRSDGYGGSAVLLNKNIKFRRIKFSGTGENVIIQTLNLQTNVTVASVYLNPQTNRVDFAEHTNRLFMLMQREKNSFVCGDFNAKHINWGNPSNNHKGTYLQNIISSSNFNVLNDGNPTFHRFFPDIDRHKSARPFKSASKQQKKNHGPTSSKNLATEETSENSGIL